MPFPGKENVSKIKDSSLRRRDEFISKYGSKLFIVVGLHPPPQKKNKSAMRTCNTGKHGSPSGWSTGLMVTQEDSSLRG